MHAELRYNCLYQNPLKIEIAWIPTPLSRLREDYRSSGIASVLRHVKSLLQEEKREDEKKRKIKKKPRYPDGVSRREREKKERNLSSMHNRWLASQRTAQLGRQGELEDDRK